MRGAAPRHLDEIDGLRAIAVLAVLAYHTILDSSNVPVHACVACGARGVDLFFSISGFCLAYPYLQARRSGAMVLGYGRFVLRRLTRIAPAYYVALALFALLAFTPFGLPTAEPGIVTTPIGVLRSALADALFLTGKSPALNASFWTLGIEMRWYLVFPILLGLYVRSYRLFLALIVACYGLYWFTPYGIADLGILPCFLLGIVAAQLRISHPKVCAYAPLGLAVALAAAVAQQSGSSVVDHGDPLWHLSAFFFVLSSGARIPAAMLRFRPLRLVGIASYSIYLVHQPILDAVGRIGFSPLASAVAGLACGFAFYACVERPFFDRRFRSTIEGAFSAAGQRLKRRFVPVPTTSS